MAMQEIQLVKLSALTDITADLEAASAAAALATMQGLNEITPTLGGYDQTQRELPIVAGVVTVPLDGKPSYVIANAVITGWTIVAPESGMISDVEVAVWYSGGPRAVAMPTTYSANGVGALPFSTVANFVHLIFFRRIPGPTYTYRADVVPYKV